MKRDQRFQYNECCDCGEKKTGHQRKSQRCRACGNENREHHGTAKYYDKCKDCGVPKITRGTRHRDRCPPCAYEHRHKGCVKRTRPEVGRMRELVGAHVRNAMRNNKQGQPVFQHLPYTIQEMMEHLEKQFDDKMSWQNQGSYWHLDHIVPQVLLPYKSYDDVNFSKCWDLRNLQPLEATLNCAKGPKLTEQGKALMEIL